MPRQRIDEPESERREKIVGYIWACGDDICDCTQPVIERYTPKWNLSYGYDIARLWEGTFTSGTYEDRSHEEIELRAAIAQRVWGEPDDGYSDTARREMGGDMGRP